MATILKRGARWYIKYRDANGRQKMVKGFSDKGQTTALGRKLEDEARGIKLGYIDPQEEIRRQERSRAVDDQIKEYSRHLEVKGCTANHVSYTTADIQKCFTFTGIQQAAALTKDHVDRWVSTLTADSARTVNRRVKSVIAFLRYLQDRGAVNSVVLKGFAMRKVKGTEKRIYRHLTIGEVAKLIEKTPDDHRKLIYRFALQSGFRFGEICSLTPSSFNFSKKTVTVSANNAKNKGQHQTIPLAADLVGDLKKRTAEIQPDELMFNMPARENAAPQLKADCRVAGIDEKNVVFHSLRHTFITRLAEANIHPKILQTLARHASLETTLGYYVHFRQADERAAIDALAHPIA